MFKWVILIPLDWLTVDPFPYGRGIDDAACGYTSNCNTGSIGKYGKAMKCQMPTHSQVLEHLTMPMESHVIFELLKAPCPHWLIFQLSTKINKGPETS